MMEFTVIVRSGDVEGAERFLEENVAVLRPREGIFDTFCGISRSERRQMPEMTRVILGACGKAGRTPQSRLRLVHWEEEEEVNACQELFIQEGRMLSTRISCRFRALKVLRHIYLFQVNRLASKTRLILLCHFSFRKA